MRLLYLYPEEWTGSRAREVHTLSTCLALAEAGVEVELVTAGGRMALRAHVCALAGKKPVANFHAIALSRAMGPIRSISIFWLSFRRWMKKQGNFDASFIIHLKAAEILRRAKIPYLYEAHEIFAETRQKKESRQRRLERLERDTLEHAKWRVATSGALAAALRERYTLPNDFKVVPNAGGVALAESIAAENGPFVYAGSIADWKGLELVVAAARTARVPLKIVGGTAVEWKTLGLKCDVAGVEWQPRVALADLPNALSGARAGLIPTQPTSGSGRYSCPMKIFDYARCGLPVLSTALPSLKSLDVGSWCRQINGDTSAAWAESLRQFRFDLTEAKAAQAWAGEQTWAVRGQKILAMLAGD